MALTLDIPRIAQWVTEGTRNEGNELAKEQKSMQATLDSVKATGKKSAWKDLAEHYLNVWLTAADLDEITVALSGITVQGGRMNEEQMRVVDQTL